ncbi:hypothetical protein [Desulfonatronovibrio magnus]|uniref:hypothetical protein n=1 Tax=Desulfonatronovibrio magnus TaxID=698827 RepID=UPI0005EBADF6|nr:hypothetical protein [Desulfonatronovibrio magnus]
MNQAQKQALQVTKEIVVKFIEVGRISPSNCHELFSQIYKEVLQTIEADIQSQQEVTAEDGDTD